MYFCETGWCHLPKRDRKDKRVCGATWWVQNGPQGTKFSLGSKVRMPAGRSSIWGLEQRRDDKAKCIDGEERGAHDGILGGHQVLDDESAKYTKKGTGGRRTERVWFHRSQSKCFKEEVVNSVKCAMTRNSSKMPENYPLGLDSGWSLVNTADAFIGVIEA